MSAALEDEALERELSNHGIPIHRSRAVRVSTSARTEGRAPRGLAHDLTVTDWRARRSFRADQFPLQRLLAAKREPIAVVLPAREVAATIGPIAKCVCDLRSAGLIDEAVVVDSASLDGTAEIAATAGLRVVQEDELMPECGPAQGKGDAMWRALSVVRSDVVAYLDADTENFHPGFVLGLLGPLICEPQIQFVKGCFQRPFRDGAGSGSESIPRPGQGGRVTELLARPLLNLHAPELAVFDQPLAGEMAARRELLVRLPFSVGYGVEIAMLIDAWRAVGLDGLAQVDLGSRQNAHQSLRELSAMAYAVLVAASARFLGTEFADTHASGSIALPPQESRRADGDAQGADRGASPVRRAPPQAAACTCARRRLRPTRASGSRSPGQAPVTEAKPRREPLSTRPLTTRNKAPSSASATERKLAEAGSLVLGLGEAHDHRSSTRSPRRPSC